MDMKKIIAGVDLCGDKIRICYYDDTEPAEGETRTGRMLELPVPAGLAILMPDAGIAASKPSVTAGKAAAGTEAVTAEAASAETEAAISVTEAAPAETEAAISVTEAAPIETEAAISVTEAAEPAEDPLRWDRFAAETGQILAALRAACPDGELYALTFTLPEIGGEAARAIRRAAAEAGVRPERISLQSHVQSFVSYALSQSRELWTYSVGLFEYGRQGMQYYRLDIDRQQRPMQAAVTREDLSESLPWDPASEIAPEEKDRRFAGLADQVTEKVMISSFYLVGEGFGPLEADYGWMETSLQRLSRKRRRIFAGQNLYAEGAARHSLELARLVPAPEYHLQDSELVDTDIYIQGLHRNVPYKILLFEAGRPWYEDGREKPVLPQNPDKLYICMQKKGERTPIAVSMALTGLPRRPEGTTRLGVTAGFGAPGLCHITVRDLGFGELFPASAGRWEMDLPLESVGESLPSVKEHPVIEATEPVVSRALDLCPEPVRLYSLEELCWYISENYYRLEESFFDTRLYDWMDAITGGHELAKALMNFQAAGRPLRDLLKLLFNSVDYLTAAKAAAIYSYMAGMERLDPAERTKALAELEAAGGRYLPALRHYLHAAWLMEHDYADAETSVFKAAVYRGTGLTLLRLHDLPEALLYLQKALAVSPDRENIRACALLQLYRGDQSAFEALKAAYPGQESLLAEAAGDYRAWEQSQTHEEVPARSEEDYDLYIRRLRRIYSLV